MSFLAKLTGVEETDRKWEPTTQSHDGNRRWLLLFSDHDPVATGNLRFVERARTLIGEVVYVARGGKEGIIGTIRLPDAADRARFPNYHDEAASSSSQGER